MLNMETNSHPKMAVSGTPLAEARPPLLPSFDGCLHLMDVGFNVQQRMTFQSRNVTMRREYCDYSVN